MATTLGNRARVVVLAAGMLVGGLALLLLARRLGETILPFAVLAVIAVIVVQRPGWALAVALIPAVMIEDTVLSGAFLNIQSFYEPSHVLSPFEALVALLAVATAFDVAQRRDLRMPEPLTLPLMLLAAALACGLVVGLFNGASFNAVTTQIRPLILLLAMPIIVVNAVRDREAIRRVLLVAAFLVAIKAVIGIGTVLAGQGIDQPGEPQLSYLPVTANFLSMAFVLVFLAALVDRRRPPAWVFVIAILAATSLVLSYRRSFWIGGTVGMVMVLLIGAGRLRWRTLLPGVAVVVVAVWLTINTGVVGDLSGPVVERAESLNPTKIELNAQDRYRIGERKNVVADIEDHPITGLGLAVPWTGRFPPSVDRPRAREYVHFTALWWWLKLGVLGLIAYLWLMASGTWTAFRVWREQHDPWLRAMGLGLTAALIGLAIAETTAGFTGVADRFSVVIGAVLGLLAATLADARRAPDREAERRLSPPTAPEPSASEPPAARVAR
jgi:O-antigen ligase